MRHAIIYKPCKTAMQSGMAKTRFWVLQITNSGKVQFVEPVMGWTGGEDTLKQICLRFSGLDEAIAWAESRNIPYSVINPHPGKIIPKSYADNFRPRVSC